MITRNGVCYDLSKSNYKHIENGVVFVFSSKLHLDKFKRKLTDNRKLINMSLTKRFSCGVDVSILADIVLYKKIETRGFLIVYEGIELWEKEQVIFAGGKVTKKNF